MTRPASACDHRQLVERLLQGPARRGFNTQALLDSAGIAPDFASRPEPVSAQPFMRLLWQVAIAMEDENFGLTERPLKPGSTNLIMEMALHCSSIGAAIEQSGRLYAAMTDEIRLVWEECADEGVLAFELRRPELDPDGFLVDFRLLQWHRMLSWFSGVLLPVTRLERRSPEAPQDDRLCYYIRRDWQTGCARDALALSARHLNLPIIRSRSELQWQTEVGRAGMPVWPEAERSTSARLRSLMAAERTASGAIPTLEQLAQRLCLSSRTLHRRLAQEGTTYRQLLGATRMGIANDLLHLQACRVEEVAQQLGFADARSFTRAFRQWTGLPPSAYRRRLGAGPSH